MPIVKHRRGLKLRIPMSGLQAGEIVIATDTQEGFFGKEDGTRAPFKVAAENVTGLTTPPTFIHDQAIPADTWTVTHDMPGKYPAVTVVDSAGSKVIGDVQYVGTNVIVLTFTSAFSGKAYLN